MEESLFRVGLKGLIRRRQPVPVSPILFSQVVITVPVTMTGLVTQYDPDQVDRPDEPWKYPYVAGVVDYGTNFKVTVQSASDSAVGYRIAPGLYISKTDQAALGFLDEFCGNHDIYPRLREMENTYRLEITKRDDVRHFLNLVRPYLIARQEAAAVMVDRLIAGLEDRQHSDRGGFLQLMGHVDRISELTGSSGHRKYTKEYFQDEWDQEY